MARATAGVCHQRLRTLLVPSAAQHSGVTLAIGALEGTCRKATKEAELAVTVPTGMAWLLVLLAIKRDKGF